MTFTIELPGDDRDDLLAVAERYGADPGRYGRLRSDDVGRDVAPPVAVLESVAGLDGAGLRQRRSCRPEACAVPNLRREDGP